MRIRKTHWLLVIGLAAVAGLLAPAQAENRRLVVQMNEPFECGGQLFAAGELSLREVQSFSPVANLNEIRVDGQSLGVVVARVISGSSVSTRDELHFVRSKDGHLVLASVAVQGEPVRRLQAIGKTFDARQPRVATTPPSKLVAMAN